MPVIIRGVGVEFCAVVDADHTLRPATVEVFVNDHDGPADLTPTEARELARLLLDAPTVPRPTSEGVAV